MTNSFDKSFTCSIVKYLDSSSTTVMIQRLCYMQPNKETQTRNKSSESGMYRNMKFFVILQYSKRQILYSLLRWWYCASVQACNIMTTSIKSIGCRMIIKYRSFRSLSHCFQIHKTRHPSKAFDCQTAIKCRSFRSLSPFKIQHETSIKSCDYQTTITIAFRSLSPRFCKPNFRSCTVDNLYFAGLMFLCSRFDTNGELCAHCFLDKCETYAYSSLGMIDIRSNVTNKNKKEKSMSPYLYVRLLYLALPSLVNICL